jgi:hypothetical protein
MMRNSNKIAVRKPEWRSPLEETMVNGGKY